MQLIKIFASIVKLSQIINFCSNKIYWQSKYKDKWLTKTSTRFLLLNNTKRYILVKCVNIGQKGTKMKDRNETQISKEEG